VLSCVRRLAAMPVVALFAIGTPWTCNLVVGPAPSPSPRDVSPEKRTETAQARQALGSGVARNAPGLPIRLPEEAVVRALDAGQPLFVRCFRKAHDADPTWASIKVKVHLEIDANGLVASVRSDAADPALAACLARIARNLPFPAPGKAATVELPLFFRT
jgi:hypothetical protein